MRFHRTFIFGFFLLIFLVVIFPLPVFFSHHQKEEGGRLSVLASSTQILTVEQSILDNIAQNGYDPNTPGGGLWVNWRYGTNPLQTNFDGTGTPYPGGLGINHDPLTDIRYIHNLWLYKSQNPSDNRYDSEIAKYTPIVKAEWTNPNNQRGWLFDEEFIDIYKLSGDSFYKDAATSLVTNYSKQINPSVGIMYKTSTTHPQGYYRPTDVIEAGCALIQAGTLFNNPTWTQQGQTAVNFVFSHAYISQYHTFGEDMDQVLTPSGSVNPNEIFYIDNFRNYVIHGNEIRMGSISQIITSLLNTYRVTKNSDYLNKATDLLDPFSLPGNALGMWDTNQLGYFSTATFSGPSPQQPGTVTVAPGKKEAGRQVIMLWAYHLANQFTNNKYSTMEQQMLTVSLTKAYYAPGHGVIYETNADWTPLKFSNGTLNDIVTTEAMGAELEGLFSVGNSIQTTGIPTTPPTTISPSVPAGSTIFSGTLCPHGLGNCGDNVNPGSGGNTNPLHISRNVTLSIFDSNNIQIAQQQGQVMYVSQAQNFQGTIPVSSLPSGNYIVSIKMDGFLSKQIPGIITVSQGQTITLPSVSLITGDINNDDQLDILDYNILIGCFGSKQNVPSCTMPPTSTSSGADINDDGMVNGVDYNLLLRELSVQHGG